MRGLGFTANSTAIAMEAAASPRDRDLGAPFDVLQRMASIALSGLADEQHLRSLGIDSAAVGKAMRISGPEVRAVFPALSVEDRLIALAIAMEK